MLMRMIKMRREKMHPMLRNKIPVTAIVVTKNEEANIVACLSKLKDFDEVVVVDSMSDDRTCALARGCGARVVDFEWNGQYPKKRQWCLDQLELKHDWVFFIDADEGVTGNVVEEIAALFDGCEPCEAGFFVRSDCVWGGKMLRYGLKNNKLVLFDRRRVESIDDGLNIRLLTIYLLPVWGRLRDIISQF